MGEEGEEKKATKPQAILGGWPPEFPVVPHQQHLLVPEGDNNDFSTLRDLTAWGGLFHTLTPLLFNPIP